MNSHSLNEELVALGAAPWWIGSVAQQTERYPYNVTFVCCPNLPAQKRGFAVASDEGNWPLMSPSILVLGAYVLKVSL